MWRVVCLLLSLTSALEVFAQGIYQIDKIQEVRIFFDRPDWSKALDSLKNAGEEARLLGDLVFNGVKYEGVGIRYKGNSSFNSVRKEGSDKLPFNIKINYQDNNHSFPDGYTSLKLSNVFRDPSFLREVLSYEIAGKYMPAPRANFAKVYVNDRYLGLYNSSESVDEKFLRDKFGSTTGTLVKCDPYWQAKSPAHCPAGHHSSLVYQGTDSLCYLAYYEMKTLQGWEDLITLTQTLNKDPGNIESILDIDQTLWMHAFNIVLVNLDSYSGMLCHNYYLFQDTFGVFHPIVWDMNLSFGGFRYAEEGKALTKGEMQQLSPLLHFRNEKRPLIMNLLATDLYRKVFLAHVRTIIDENFTGNIFAERARAIHEMIAPHVEKDGNKLYDFQNFKLNIDSTAVLDNQEIIGLTELMGPRIEYLSNHPLLNNESPRIVNVAHQKSGADLSVEAQVAGALRVWLCYRQKGKGRFQRLEMKDGVGDAEQPEAESRWMVNIPLAPGIQYYIIAEGERMASLSPERASLDFYEVK